MQVLSAQLVSPRGKSTKPLRKVQAVRLEQDRQDLQELEPTLLVDEIRAYQARIKTSKKELEQLKERLLARQNELRRRLF